MLQEINFFWAYIITEQIVICLSMVQNVVATQLCLGNISKDWSIDNMKKTGFNGYVYDLSVDYDATDVDDVVNIPKYW